MPLLDAARQRLGDPEAPRRRRRQQVAVAARWERMADVVEDLIAADDSEMQVMSMLRGQDMQNVLVDEAAMPGVDTDALVGPFAHVVVDEAQEPPSTPGSPRMPREPRAPSVIAASGRRLASSRSPPS